MRKRQTRRGLLCLAILFVVLVITTWLAVLTNLDCRLSALFYNSQTGWHLAASRFWRMIYRFGPAPGLVLMVASLAGLVSTLYVSRLRPLRRPLAVVFLTAIIGSGLIVNAVLKPYWGRPRPRETTMFGGIWEYRAPYQMGTPGRGKSFPCGHCTMGYLFVALLAFRRRARFASAAGAVFGLISGTLLGIARIIQGAHFATDVLWALGIMLMVYVALEYLVLPRTEAWLERARRILLWRRRWPIAVASSMAVLGLIAFLTFRPVYETYNHVLPLTADIRKVIVNAEGPQTRLLVRWGRQATAMFRINAAGIGWVNARLKEYTLLTPEDGATLRISYRLLARGLYSELGQQVEIILPEPLKGRISVWLAGSEHADAR